MAAVPPKELIGSYEVYQTLGKGAFGTVYKVKRQHDDPDQNPFYALKLVQFSSKHKDIEMKCLQREESILKSLNHHHIVKYLESFVLGNTFIIVMEYCSGGTLYQHIRIQESQMQEDIFICQLKQIADGLKYLHNKNVLHRDVKTKNILIAEGNVLKISDFGVSRLQDIPREYSKLMGTFRYMSPEILRQEEYDSKTDIWSLACTAYEMAVMKHAFSSESLKKVQQDIVNNKSPDFTEIDYCKETIELLKAMFHHDPKERPSAEDIVDRLSAHECTKRLSQEIKYSRAQSLESNESSGYCKHGAGKKQDAKKSKPPKDKKPIIDGGKITLKNPSMVKDIICHLKTASTDVQKCLVNEINRHYAVDMVAEMKKKIAEMSKEEFMENTKESWKKKRFEKLQALIETFYDAEHALIIIRSSYNYAEDNNFEESLSNG